jgi:hypothetical protein
MASRLLFVVALSVALSVTALGSPLPSTSPAPGAVTTAATDAPTLAPIDVAATPGPQASGESGQPKVLGHLFTSAYCSSFVERFNVAATTIVADDQHLTDVDGTLRDIDDNYDRRDGASRVYDDRVKLIDEVSQMLKTIPVTQSAVNDLLAQAKSTTDPDRKAALQESASALQKTVDRQRAVADDLTSVIHVLMDKHTTEDTAEYAINYLLPPGEQETNISLLDDPVPEPGKDSMMESSPSPSPSPGATTAPGTVEDVLQWSRQRGIIGTNESRAATAASRVVRICDDEHLPTAPPNAVPIAPPTSSPSTSP